MSLEMQDDIFPDDLLKTLNSQEFRTKIVEKLESLFSSNDL